MKKVCRRKNEKEPYAAHRNARRMINLNESSQQNGCRNTSDARDDKPRNKIISADIGNQANQPWKQRIKHKRAVGGVISEFRDLLIIPRNPTDPIFRTIGARFLTSFSKSPHSFQSLYRTT